MYGAFVRMCIICVCAQHHPEKHSETKIVAQSGTTSNYERNPALRKIFVLEMFEDYIRRKEDVFLRFYPNPMNEIQTQRV